MHFKDSVTHAATRSDSLYDMSFRLRQPPRSHESTTASPSSTPPTALPLSQPLPHGVVLSAHSGHPVTSSGLRSLDASLSGGLPLSSLTLLAADAPSAYHVAFMNYVAAQGIAHGHALALASFCASSNSILPALPRCTGSSSSSASTRPPADMKTDMQIAWRYQARLQKVLHGKAALDTHYTSEFDVSTPRGHDDPLPASYPLSEIPVDVSDRACLTTLLRDVEAHLTRAAERRLLSRVLVYGLSSFHRASDSDITEFLTRLRSLARVYGCVIVVSYDPAAVPFGAARAAADALLALDSFGGRGAGAAGLGTDWLGVLAVKKAYRLGPAPAHQQRGRGDVWVFKRGRRKYTLERATAAPEEGDADARHDDDEDGGEQVSAASVLCGTGPRKNNLEF